MAKPEFRFPFYGHGSEDSDALWIVFRDPVAAGWKLLSTSAPEPFALDEPHDRVALASADDDVSRRQYKAVDAWLQRVHDAHPIAFAAYADSAGDGAWHDWSKKQTTKVVLPWLVETWRSPAFASAHAASAQAQLIAHLKTKKLDAIALAAAAIEAGFGCDARADREQAGHLAALIARAPEPGALAASLSPTLRLLVWASGQLVALTPAAVTAALAALGDAAKPFGREVARIADALGAPELHAAALELDGAPVESFLVLATPDRIEDMMRQDFDRYAESDLEVLLHGALERELDPLIDRCVAVAAERLGPEVPGIVSNVIYATTRAGRAHVSVRIARDFYRRFRAKRRDRMLATLYTNILLAYGTSASSDDTVGPITEELEQILRDDPAYFGFSGDKTADILTGRAGYDILASAYGSAACGRAVMGDGPAAARWLAVAKEHAWSDLAVCSNLVCFQNMRGDPHVSAVVREIARAEVARLEAGLRGKDAKNVHALFSLALTLHNGGFLDDAERYYRRVLEVQPKHADSLNNLGNLFGTRGDIDRAIASYDAAIAVVPEHPLFHACRGWALARARRYRDGVASSTRSIELDPNQAAGYFSRGAAWLGLGDRDRAAADFRRGAELNPGWPASEKDDPWFAEMAAIIGGPG